MNKDIEEKTNEMIENARTAMRSNGVELSENEEYFIRVGMEDGLSILANLHYDITIKKEKNNEAQIS